LIVHAPAKINLCLHVTGQRADGYHLLESVVCFSDISDQLTFSAALQDALSFSGPFGALLDGDDGANLVIQARDALRRTLPDRHCPAVSIHLEKNLPLASGIGGGSADAAATLRALNAFWRLGLSLSDLAQIGSGIGADVPMCVYGLPLIAKGIGEIIEPIVEFPKLPLLLINPNVAVSTPAIFKDLKSKSNGSLPRLPSRALRSPKNLMIWLRETRNDLESPARDICPAISQVLSAFNESGAKFARMSGSGATCFGIFPDAKSINSAKAWMNENHPNWWVA
jgi:4-diphosphocytidyl-2-C-methyl-D-erythritol kinase